MIGSTTSHYRILEKLGEGGMGVVYKAHDLKLDRFVALKFLPERISANEVEQVRFIQEAKAAASLNHPNICTIHGIEEDDDKMFIVMEYVDGDNLGHLNLHESSLETIVTFSLQIAEALQEAHGKGIVHRDIKADNIMVNSKNHVKVMDFGLAKLKGSLKLTRSTSTVGTLAYMAPEQIQHGDVDRRADIFSYGVLLFEMLTGRFPFRGEHAAALMYSIMNENPEALEHVMLNAPAELSHIIRRCLERDPADRYQEMKEVVVELGRFERDMRIRFGTAGIKRPKEAPPSGQGLFGGRVPWTKKSRIIAGAVVLGSAAAAYYFFGRPPASIDSIAVMPFSNTGRELELEYICDGLTESVINTTSQIPNLKVISWSTASRFKGKEIDPRMIGTEFDVDAVLFGRVVKRDSILLISVELINANDNAQLWGEQYSRQPEDLMHLETSISKNIVEKLRLRLSKETQERVSKLYTENAIAYRIYLKGRYQWNKRNPESLRQSIELFQQAIQSDPEYALAYAGLADAYTVYGNFNLTRPQESFPKAKRAAFKALELDGNLAEAHTSLGYASMYYDRDWAAAEQSFKRAIQLNPNYAVAHSWYSFLLTLERRFEEASLERSLALELDPFSPAINTDAGITAYFQGNIPEAVRSYQRTLEIDPLFVAAYVPLAGAHLEAGEFDKAIEILQRASVFSGGHPIAVAALGYSYAKSGRSDEAISMQDLLFERMRDEYMSPYWIAVLYVGLGNFNQALVWLGRALEERDGFMVFLNVEPIFQSLHQDPAFRAILKKMNLQSEF